MSYINGETIKSLREKQNLTQRRLADLICVSDKTVSKWETCKGLPDIGIIEDLAKALKVSVAELLSGDIRTNKNLSGNLNRMKFYVCPICGNIITSVGDCITMDHPMTKSHYVSFIAYVTTGNVEIIKLYPEQDICVRFKKKGLGYIYAFCNRDRMFKIGPKI